MALQSVFFQIWILGRKFFRKQYCEKNWLYALLELCFVQKIVQNGQKVRIETWLNFGEIGKKCDKFLILQYSVTYWPILASLYFRPVLWQIFPHSFELFGTTIRCRVWCYDKVGNSFFTFIGSGRWWWQKWTQLKIRGVVSNLHLQSECPKRTGTVSWDWWLNYWFLNKHAYA